MPKISIILPTFNVEKYIAKALESCINQTFKDIEIIVVDDCGSDKSIDIAKEYSKKDKRIKIIHNEKNLGLLRARYEGVKVANSLYIMFLDPDDYLELEACEEVSKYLDQNNDLICFNFTKIYNQEKKDLCFYYINGNYNISEFRYFLFTRYPYMQWNIWAKVLKKEKYLNAYKLLEISDNDKINMAEDAFLYIFYLPLCNYIQTLDKSLINYCILDNSLSNGLTSDKLLKIVYDMRYLYKRIQTIKKKNKKLFSQYKGLYDCFSMAFEREIYAYYFTYLKDKERYNIFHRIFKKYLKIKNLIFQKIYLIFL
ncbi:glycosyltransferase family 2 protein [Campylobacter jejuni]